MIVIDHNIPSILLLTLDDIEVLAIKLCTKIVKIGLIYNPPNSDIAYKQKF